MRVFLNKQKIFISLILLLSYTQLCITQYVPQDGDPILDSCKYQSQGCNNNGVCTEQGLCLCNEMFHGKFCQEEITGVEIKHGGVTSAGIAGITFGWILGTIVIYVIGYFIATFIGEKYFGYESAQEKRTKEIETALKLEEDIKQMKQQEEEIQKQTQLQPVSIVKAPQNQQQNPTNPIFNQNPSVIPMSLGTQNQQASILKKPEEFQPETYYDTLQKQEQPVQQPPQNYFQQLQQPGGGGEEDQYGMQQGKLQLGMKKETSGMINFNESQDGPQKPEFSLPPLQNKHTSGVIQFNESGSENSVSKQNVQQITEEKNEDADESNDNQHIVLKFISPNDETDLVVRKGDTLLQVKENLKELLGNDDAEFEHYIWKYNDYILDFNKTARQYSIKAWDTIYLILQANIQLYEDDEI